jgi:autotransporter-associated beta strand protein
MKNWTHIALPLGGDHLLTPRFQARAVVLIPVLLLFLLAGGSTTFAGSATWNTAPATGDWNTAANWTPPTVPNSSGDTATFATSNRTGVSLSGTTQASAIVFNPGASAFTITDNSFAFTLSGLGINNGSTTSQSFVAGADAAGGHGTLTFASSATAGNRTVVTATSPTLSGASGGLVQFQNASSANHGAFINNGSMVSQSVGGVTVFYDTSTAANSTITNNGGTVTGAGGGSVLFLDSSTAANATLTSNDGVGGEGGGTIDFLEDTNGGTARLRIFGNGELEISRHNAPGLTTGSIEGSGEVFLGANNLTVGGNNLSTSFSGVMQDGGHGGGTGGSLTKTGTGTLTLTGANTYTGTTTVSAGTLLVKNRHAGTGTGPVTVNAGTLGGTGTIAGNVTVGTGSGPGAFLAPGIKPTTPATLTIQGALTFNADSTYAVNLNLTRITADTVVANGVTIASNAQFSFIAGGNGTLPLGTVFTLINNTAATPIAGVFVNLPNGSTITAGSNRLQVNYQGGSGNDLTLTVVP